MGHPLIQHLHGAAAPPQPRGLARPARSFKRLEGSAAAADAKRQGEQPTGGYGTAKGAAGPARHVPTRARNEPGRADDVTVQTSDRRCATTARATARLLHRSAATAGGVTERLTTLDQGWRTLLPRASASRVAAR